MMLPADGRLSPQARGVLLATGTALISGLAVYLNAFGVRQVPDAVVYTTAKNGVAALILVGLLFLFGRGREAVNLNGRRRLGLLAVALIGGSVPFVLFFSGLAMASAPSAAFIHKTLFIWVAVLAVPLLGERLGYLQIGAMGVLLAGVLLVGPPLGLAWGLGETMIAAATLFWSVEVVVAKRLLAGISSNTLAVARMGLGFVVLLGYLGLTGRLGGLFALSADGLFWVLVTGLLLAGYVSTWYAGLRLAPATTVTSVLVGGGVVTAVLTVIGGGAAPGAAVLVGYLLIALSVAVIMGLTLGLTLGAGRASARRRVPARG
ncbi:MAG TPA: DMT family transporter [Candidatus Limnocylindria bacterium]|nr:DMT family transporter [Candidatus Limnocylindria bacterium]